MGILPLLLRVESPNVTLNLLPETFDVPLHMNTPDVMDNGGTSVVISVSSRNPFPRRSPSSFVGRVLTTSLSVRPSEHRPGPYTGCLPVVSTRSRGPEVPSLSKDRPYGPLSSPTFWVLKSSEPPSGTMSPVSLETVVCPDLRSPLRRHKTDLMRGGPPTTLRVSSGGHPLCGSDHGSCDTLH